MAVGTRLQLPRLFIIDGDRLVDIHILAGFERTDCVRDVFRMAQRDRYKLDGGIVDQLFARCITLRLRRNAGRIFEPRRIVIRNRDEFEPVRILGNFPDVHADSGTAHPEDSDFDCFSHAAHLPCFLSCSSFVSSSFSGFSVATRSGGSGCGVTRGGRIVPAAQRTALPITRRIFASR